MEMVNNRGPRIDPWGTPQKRGAREEEALFFHTERPVGQIRDEALRRQITVMVKNQQTQQNAIFASH